MNKEAKTRLEDRLISFMLPWEGTSTVGSVPWRRNPVTGEKEPIMSSGVTIAMGCDLGQQTIGSLRKMGLSDDLVFKLTPYLGLTKKAAMRFLEAHPLSITKEEEQQINRGIVGLYIDYARAEFDGEDPVVKFDDLTMGCQIALTSLRFHLGVGKKKYPKTFGYFRDGYWNEAAMELMTASRWPSSWPKNFVERRYAEGEKVLQYL